MPSYWFRYGKNYKTLRRAMQAKLAMLADCPRLKLRIIHHYPTPVMGPTPKPLPPTKPTAQPTRWQRFKIWLAFYFSESEWEAEKRREDKRRRDATSNSCSRATF